MVSMFLQSRYIDKKNICIDYSHIYCIVFLDLVENILLKHWDGKNKFSIFSMFFFKMSTLQKLIPQNTSLSMLRSQKYAE